MRGLHFYRTVCRRADSPALDSRLLTSGEECGRVAHLSLSFARVCSSWKANQQNVNTMSQRKLSSNELSFGNLGPVYGFSLFKAEVLP